MAIQSKKVPPSAAVMQELMGYLTDLSSYVGTPVDVTAGIVWVESNFDPTSFRYNTTNSKDRSYGLMHLTLPTAMAIAKANGYTSIKQTDLYDPIFNMWLGMTYLLQQYNRYGDWTDAISAYNGGHALKYKNGTYANNAYIVAVTNSAQQMVVA